MGECVVGGGVGEVEGDFEGSRVGLFDGFCVEGVFDGTKLGLSVGLELGRRVGLLVVGRRVGLQSSESSNLRLLLSLESQSRSLRLLNIAFVNVNCPGLLDWKLSLWIRVSGNNKITIFNKK